MKRTRRLWIGLAILILLSPLGIILPAKFHAGSAWGEWSLEEVKAMIGYKPSGMSQHTDRWKALMPDYTFKGHESKSLPFASISYIISGVLGVAIVVGITMLIGRILAGREHSDST